MLFIVVESFGFGITDNAYFKIEFNINEPGFIDVLSDCVTGIETINWFPLATGLCIINISEGVVIPL